MICRICSKRCEIEGEICLHGKHVLVNFRSSLIFRKFIFSLKYISKKVKAVCKNIFTVFTQQIKIFILTCKYQFRMHTGKVFDMICMLFVMEWVECNLVKYICHHLTNIRSAKRLYFDYQFDYLKKLIFIPWNLLSGQNRWSTFDVGRGCFTCAIIDWHVGQLTLSFFAPVQFFLFGQCYSRQLKWADVLR